MDANTNAKQIQNVEMYSGREICDVLDVFMKGDPIQPRQGINGFPQKMGQKKRGTSAHTICTYMPAKYVATLVLQKYTYVQFF